MNLKHNIKMFFLGFSCFIISQVVLRLPLLKFLSSTYIYATFQVQYSVLFGIIIALSAGIFEECGRYLFRKYAIKSNEKFSEPVMFGLGHGLAEVAFIFITYWAALNFISYLGIYERILALIFHICMSVLVWRGFIKTEEKKFLTVAISLHFVFDYLIFIGQIMSFKIYTNYIIWTIMDILLILYLIKIRKDWKER